MIDNQRGGSGNMPHLDIFGRSGIILSDRGIAEAAFRI